MTLPSPPTGSTTLTCYVDVVEPNGVTRTYYKKVTVNTATMTTSDFDIQVQNAIMDDLLESM
jgi:hypothetical protein